MRKKILMKCDYFNKKNSYNEKNLIDNKRK